MGRAMRNELTIWVVLIRRATLDDLPALGDLAWAAFEAKVMAFTSNEGAVEYRHFCATEAMAARLAEGNAFWLGEIDGELRVMAETREAAHLVMLFVAPDVFGQGLGRRMLEYVFAAEQRAHKTSRDWTVSSSPNAVGFYVAMGFAPTGPEQIKNGLRFLPMRMTRS